MEREWNFYDYSSLILNLREVLSTQNHAYALAVLRELVGKTSDINNRSILRIISPEFTVDNRLNLDNKLVGKPGVDLKSPSSFIQIDVRWLDTHPNPKKIGIYRAYNKAKHMPHVEEPLYYTEGQPCALLSRLLESHIQDLIDIDNVSKQPKKYDDLFYGD